MVQGYHLKSNIETTRQYVRSADLLTAAYSGYSRLSLAGSDITVTWFQSETSLSALLYSADISQYMCIDTLYKFVRKPSILAYPARYHIGLISKWGHAVYLSASDYYSVSDIYTYISCSQSFQKSPWLLTSNTVLVIHVACSF